MKGKESLKNILLVVRSQSCRNSLDLLTSGGGLRDTAARLHKPVGPRATKSSTLNNVSERVQALAELPYGEELGSYRAAVSTARL